MKPGRNNLTAKVTLVLTTLGATILLIGCDSSSEKKTPDEPRHDDITDSVDTIEGIECYWANDGTCDEPINCALGTDNEDCDQVCTSGDKPHLYGAACAHRSEKPSPVERAKGSEGNVHLRGHRDGTLEIPSGKDPNTLVHRHFRLYVPTTYRPEEPAPVVIMLSGHRMDIYSLANYTQLQRTAEMNGFILVYAEQEWRWDSFKWAWWTDWYWESVSVENPDLIFLRKLVERMASEYNIDSSRVFAVGHSRGASMALIAALEIPGVIKGACVESTFTEFGYHSRLKTWSGTPMPLVFVHGVLDDDICIDCTSGGSCGVNPMKPCGNVEASDSLVLMLQQIGWNADRLKYHRLEGVTHRWQPHLNQQCWDFLTQHLNEDPEEASP